MYKKLKPWEKHLDFILFDLLFVVLTYLASGIYRFGMMFFSMREIKYLFVIVIIYFLVAVLISNYKNILRRKFTQEIRSVTFQFLITYGVFIVFLYLKKDAQAFSRILFSLSAITGYVCILAIRTIWKQAVLNLINYRERLPRMFVIGNRENVSRYVQTAAKRKYLSSNMVGAIICDDDREYVAGEEIEGIPIVCLFGDYQAYCLRHVVDEILIVTGDVTRDVEIANYFVEMGVVAHIGLTINGNFDALPNAWPEKRDGFAMYTSCYRTVSGWKLVVKRLFDIVGGLIGVILTGLVYLYVAPKIKHVDPGPAVFKQKRVGRNGRIFNIYKFRSMYMDAEERKAELMAQNEMADNHMFKIADDPRILPGIGHFIRRTSLDEFPQFINVLNGDMSLVGTRPPTVDEYEEYEPHHKARLAFKPGITGMWQTSGRSEIKDFEEIVQMDNDYIRNWSIPLDIKLIFKTIKVVLKKEGSH